MKQGDTLFILDDSACMVMAPVDGVVGKRWVLPGDRIEAGQTAFTLNRGTDIWVAVYLEETKFKEIYLGQKAQFTLDAYDKLTFEDGCITSGTIRPRNSLLFLRIMHPVISRK